MADSTPIKPKKSPDIQADSLSGMPDIEDSNDAALMVGDILEEDAIDRLLIGDNFQAAELDDMQDAFADSETDNPFIREERDMLDDIAIIPGQNDDSLIADTSLFDDANDDDRKRVKNIDEIALPELTALEQVAEISDFPETAAHAGHDFPEILFDEALAFAPGTAGREGKPAHKASASQNTSPAAFTGMEANAALQPSTRNPDSTATTGDAKKTTPNAANELAQLTERIAFLEDQLQAFKQQMAEKVDRNTMITCQDDIAKLKSALKDAGHGKRTHGKSAAPVAAYIANALAVCSLLAIIAVAAYGFDTEDRLNNLQQSVARLQEQANTAPADTASDRQAIQKQLDELRAADNQTAARIAEINKILQKNAASAKTDAALSKKMAALNSQNIQVDARIEDLQNKINTLKKNPPLTSTTAPPATKLEARKPAVAAESWTVNLIAFKQDWFAKRKAEEYASKGIPAKVSKTETKGGDWYRLSVDGFKTQAEAASYAAKVKKTLNLDSVGISHHQD